MLGRYSYIDTDTAPAAYVNSNSSNASAQLGTSARTTLETQLSETGVGTANMVARVIHAAGNFVKVKWFTNGKQVGIFKARGYTLAKAITALEYFKTQRSLAAGFASIAAIAADDTPTHPTTTQITVTGTLAGGGTRNITSKCSFVSSDPTKATVSASGLVTTVAAGATTITATYGTLTSPEVVTVG